MSGEDLLRRIGDIRARIYEQYLDVEDELPFVAVQCDGCGVIWSMFGMKLPESIDYTFRDWRFDSERPYHDLCPECA